MLSRTVLYHTLLYPTVLNIISYTTVYYFTILLQYYTTLLNCSTKMHHCTGIRYLLLSPATPRATLHCNTKSNAVLHCTLLHCTAHYFTALHTTSLHCTLFTALHSSSLYCIADVFTTLYECISISAPHCVPPVLSLQH